MTLRTGEHCYAECHIQALYAECRYADCHYADCRGALTMVVQNKERNVNQSKLTLS